MPSDHWKSQLELYDQLVAMIDQFERKGKTVPYTSSNGYMFSLLNKEGQFGIRLPKDLREQFLSEYESGPLLSHGATMREYVLVPDDLLTRPGELFPFLMSGFEYVNSLPPK